MVKFAASIAGMAWVAAAVVALPSVSSATQLLSNPGFEQDQLANGQYIYPGGLDDSWTYNGSALVNAVGPSAWYGQTPPPGYQANQFAALQGTSTLSQTFTLTPAEAMEPVVLTFLVGGRPEFGAYGGDEGYKILFNGFRVSAYFTYSGQPFEKETFNLGFLPANTYTLTFQGTGPVKGVTTLPDQTAFIDDVEINAGAVPEPSAWTMMLLGFGALGGVLRAGRRRAAFA